MIGSGKNNLKPIRLLVGLHYLRHAFNESDESVVDRWVENPYWQYFCGLGYFQHQFPLDPTLLVKWRHRVGPDKMEKLLAGTFETATVAREKRKVKSVGCQSFRNQTRTERRRRRRRSAAEPVIVRMKHDNRLRRNFSKGS